MGKIHKQAPLPFQGQKRNWVKAITSICDGLAFENQGARFTFVDVFGGSGLVAHTIKQTMANARVIYNDYDNYTSRLARAEETNEILQAITQLVEEKGIGKEKRVEEEAKHEICDILDEFQKKGYQLDMITISAWLLFTGNYRGSVEELRRTNLYINAPKKLYDVSGYLEGVEVVRDDYKNIIDKYEDDNTVFVLDPPYLSTNIDSYAMTNTWKLTDYLDILNLTRNRKYIYFTSNKSQLLELTQWLSEHTDFDGFANMKKIIKSTSAKANKPYLDIMIYNV